MTKRQMGTVSHPLEYMQKKKNEQIPYSFNQQATISNTTYLILHNVQGIEKSEKPKL